MACTKSFGVAFFVFVIFASMSLSLEARHLLQTIGPVFSVSFLSEPNPIEKLDPPSDLYKPPDAPIVECPENQVCVVPHV
ncbi:hypothetical protein AAHE18_20G200200 [Arachis hypogaea]